MSNQAAQRLNHEFIDPEHLLLGLLRDGMGIGANVLMELGVELDQLIQKVEKQLKSGPEAVAIGKLPQTPRLRKVVEYAVEEAGNLKHNYVGTEHLLLGLLRENDGVAAKALASSGVRLETARQKTLDILATGPAERLGSMFGPQK
jgi:ATP-dependent Clp protease ATP-binding subunit ClpC